MRTARAFATALLGLALAALPAPAQDGPAQEEPAQEEPPAGACQALGAVLRQARASGALERVSQEYGFAVTQTPAGGEPQPGLLLLRCEEVGDDGLRLVVRMAQDMGAEATLRLESSYLLGFDGRLRSSTLEAALGGQVERIEAAREGDLLTVRRWRGERALRPRELPWDDAVLPQMLALFVLPRLHDCFPAGTELTYRGFDFGRVDRHPSILRVLAEPVERDGEACAAVEVSDEAGTETLRLLVAPGPARALRAAETLYADDERVEERSLRPLAPDELTELRQAFGFAAPAAGDPASEPAADDR